MLGIDQEAHRISLGLKQVEPNPWEQLVEKYPVGSRLKGKVRNLTEFGAFVEVEEGIDGLIHISDLSWTKRVKHPSEVLKKGDTVEAVVLNIDAENQRLSLGLKQLATDIWDEFFAHHKVGDIVEGKIVRLTNFGAFVELAEGIEGLVHVSELDEKRVDKPEEQFKPGDVFPMKIIKVNEGEKKIGLSIRAVKQDEYAQDLQTLPRDVRQRPLDAGRRVPRRAGRPPRRSPRRSSGGDDQGRAGGRGRARVRPDAQALRGHRRRRLLLDHRRPAEGRQDRAARLRQLPRAAARQPHRPQPQDRAGVVVPAKTVPHFKPGKELRELINRA